MHAPGSWYAWLGASELRGCQLAFDSLHGKLFLALLRFCLAQVLTALAYTSEWAGLSNRLQLVRSNLFQGIVWHFRLLTTFLAPSAAVTGAQSLQTVARSICDQHGVMDGCFDRCAAALLCTRCGQLTQTHSSANMRVRHARTTVAGFGSGP